MKKLIVLLIFLMLMCGCQRKQQEDIYILYTNDVHCALDGDMNYATVAKIKKDLESEHKYVTLVDCGDFSQGKAIGGLTKGSSIIDIMNKTGYDIATIGNHDFDHGMEALRENIENAEFEITLTNVKYTGSKENAVENTKPYVIKNYDGVKVAYIGVLTPRTPIQSTPDFFKENGEYVYIFNEDGTAEGFYNSVQKSIDSAKKDGARYVILLAHVGLAEHNSPYSTDDLIANIKNADVVLDAHEHVEMIGEYLKDKEGKDVLITCTGTNLNNIGELIIKTDGTFETVLLSGIEEKDEEVQSYIDEVNTKFDEILKTKVGHTDYDLSISDGDIRIVRNRESNMADLVADAYRWYFNADIGLAHGGGVRNTIKAGDITLGDLLAVAPFSNELSFVKVRGQMIADALEFASRFTDSYIGIDGKPVGENGGFLQCSGLRYTIDTSKSADVKVDENNTLVSIGENRRVSDIEVEENGKYVPLVLDKEYTLAAPDYFIYAGGDGQTAMKDAEALAKGAAVDVDVIVSYIKDYLKGNVPAKYSEVEGRITVK